MNNSENSWIGKVDFENSTKYSKAVGKITQENKRRNYCYW